MKLRQQKGKGLKLDKQNGQFGKIRFDYPTLINGRCKVYKDNKVVLNELVDDDFVYLMTKRYNPKKSYSSESIAMLKKIMELSEKIPSEHSGKLKLLRKPCSKVYWNNIDELVQRLHLLIAAKQSGNDSIDNSNEITEILDLLLNNKVINQGQHKAISKLYT